METIKFRKRVPDSLYPFVRKKEVKRTFNTSSNYEEFKSNFSKALKFSSDASIPFDVKGKLIETLLPELTNSVVSVKNNSTKLNKVVPKYIDSLTCSQREINDRVHFLNNILSRYAGLDDISLFKHSDIKRLQKVFITKVKHRGKSISTRTANKYTTWLKNFFQFCLNQDLIDFNPAAGVKAINSDYSSARTQRDALSPTEIKLLLQATTDSDLRYFIKLCYLTGMRLSEFHKAKLVVIENIPVFDLLNIETKLKTKSSYRLVPIHRDLGGVESVKEFLIRNNEVKVQNLARRLKYLIDKTLESTNSKTCYSLRHSFATHLIDSRVDSNIASELMGHSHSTITLNRYSKGYSVKTLSSAIGHLKA